MKPTMLGKGGWGRGGGGEGEKKKNHTARTTLTDLLCIHEEQC